MVGLAIEAHKNAHDEEGSLTEGEGNTAGTEAASMKGGTVRYLFKKH